MSAPVPEVSESASSPTQSEQANRGWLERVGKALGHPLVLLLVTAAVSGLLVPQLTQQWQEQQQQVAVRRDFAARVSRTVGEIFIATQLAQVGAVSQSQEEFDAAYVRWEVESSVLGAELRAYYPDESLHDAWHRCAELATAYYTQLGIVDDAQRRQYLDEVHRELGLPANVDLADIHVLRTQVLGARDVVIQRVLAGGMI